MTPDTLTFFLACFGASSLIKVLSTEISLLNRKPFNCPLCSGFWVSLILFVLWRALPDQSSYLIYAFAGSGIAWVLYRLTSGDN